MAEITCKRCGGDLELIDEMRVGECVYRCEYCGTRQTVPAIVATEDSEKKLRAFERANRYRRACEFDKAAGMYDALVTEFPDEAEAYWGLVLCRYGMEYVADGGKRVPTCHRTSYKAVKDDPDYISACKKASADARAVYESDADEIEKLRENIINVSSKEAPYDIFISFKETDRNGERTRDSVLAQELYKALTDEGYRVFFSRISLEGKFGNYEPYIFAALASARVMLVVGTEYDNFNAVWVKNEWSRYLKQIEAGQNKTLVPCFKDMDVYDLPDELQRLQAQNLAKLGAMQDLLHGIEKLIPRQKQTEKVIERTVVGNAPVETAEGVIAKAFVNIENGNTKAAESLIDKALELDPECGRIYLAKLVMECKLTTPADLPRIDNFDAAPSYKLTRKYADAVLNAELDGYERALCDRFYRRAEKLAASESTTELRTAIALYTRCGDYLDSAAKRAACEQKLKAKDTEYLNRRSRALALRKSLAVNDTSAAVLLRDGTVFATDIPTANSWTNMVEIGLGNGFIVGLQSDGRVATAGSTLAPDCTGWYGVASLCCTDYHVAGLTRNGGVINSMRLNTSGWHDIKRVFCSQGTQRFIVGLRGDGRLIATSESERFIQGYESFTDVVDVVCGMKGFFAIRADGAVLIAGEVDKLDWKGIIGGVYAGVTKDIPICIRRNGTIAANFHGVLDNCKSAIQVEASDGSFCAALDADGKVYCSCVYADSRVPFALSEKWNHIIAIAASRNALLGVRDDGTVVFTGTAMRMPNMFCGLSETASAEECFAAGAAKRDAVIARRTEQARIEYGVCRHCGGKFKGVFKKVCSRCGLEKDY